jgi:competence protein ComEC
MSKRRRVIRFEALAGASAAVVILFFVGCANPAGDAGAGVRFTFAAADVGQGLAQIGVVGKRAVLWDVGPDSGYQGWRAAYVGLGSPRIESVIISHSHSDHYGALKSFDARADWSGELVVSPYEDTALLRESAGAWADRVKFKTCARGDTLRALSPVTVVCIWPPPDLDAPRPVEDGLKNRYGLVFSVSHGSARVLITSDIDSAAMEEIAAHTRYGLRAQLMVVPHHGSAGSVNPLFFAYAAAETAIISCARENTYGHPSDKMIAELALRWRTGILYTFISTDNTAFVSNGYYWDARR